MKKITVTTSWDDGHILDIRLATLLKKYNVKGTFYISPKDREIAPENRLSKEQITEFSKDFEIGAHTMTHPRLTDLSDDEARSEIVDSKKYLEEVIGKPVESFCYPSGYFNSRHVQMVKDAQFKLGRTVERFKTKIADPYALPTTVHAYRHWSDAWPIFKKVGLQKFWKCYFNWDELAIELFTQTSREGVFHLWGHSWEIEKNNDWARLERVLQRISSNTNVHYVENKELLRHIKIMQKTVLFVTPYFLPHGGGLERYAYEIAIRLQREYKWRVVVLTSGKKGSVDTVEDFNGLEVYRLGYQFKISNTPFSFRWFRKARALIREIDPDVLDIHLPVPGLGDIAARAAGARPVILTYHAGTMHKGKLLPDTAIWLYEHFVLPRTISKVKKIICSSEFVKASFFVNCGSRAIVITPGVDTDLFNPSKYTEKKKNEIVFVCSFASMHKLKGLHVLIDAVHRLAIEFPDISLKIIGERGTAHSRYIRFVGPKMGNMLVQEIRSGTLLVLCSLAPAESFGMVLIEAMACKLPVVGTVAGGIPEVIEDGKDGFIVPSGDPAALSEAIGKLLRDPILAAHMGEEGLKKVAAQYVWDKKVLQTQEVFDGVLQGL